MRFNQFDIGAEIQRETFKKALEDHGKDIKEARQENALRAVVAAYEIAVRNGATLPTSLVAACEMAKGTL